MSGQAQLKHARNSRIFDVKKSTLDSISKIIAIMLSRSLHLSLVTLETPFPSKTKGPGVRISYLALQPSPPIHRNLLPNLNSFQPDTLPGVHRTEILNSLRARGGHSSIHRERRWDPIRYEIRVMADDSGVGGERHIVGEGCGGNCKEEVSHRLI